MDYVYMRFPEGRAKALTLSYDDGVEQDVRLISILDKNGIRCTFNLNGGLFAPEGTVYPDGPIHRRMTLRRCAEAYADTGHEVALHGFAHAHMEQLQPLEALRDILQDRQELEAVFDRMVRGMAYPFGSYSDELVEVLRTAGVAYARTTVSTETFSIPVDWLRMPATCHHNNPRLTELANQFLDASADGQPMLFYLWGHSYEFEQNDNWQVIENFADQMGGHADIWYATNMEIYDYVTAFRSLVFSPGMRRVYNPSGRTVWFALGKDMYQIAGGTHQKLK